MSKNMRMSALAVVATCLVAQPSVGDVAQGEALYLENCATCHGLDLDGSGPMSGVMVIKPADLTMLTKANAGDFPVARIVKRIDGRDPLVSHGSPMPVYGDFFEGDDTALKTASGQPILTSRAVADLVAYLEGMQK